MKVVVKSPRVVVPETTDSLTPCSAHLRSSAEEWALRAARTGFEMERNQGFLAAVDMALMQLESKGRPEFASLLQTRAKLQKSQLPLWEAMCDLQILALKPDDQPALDRLSHNRAAEVVPHLAARRFALMGDQAAGLGRTDDAVALWTRSDELLEGLRAKLPPAEIERLRAAIKQSRLGRQGAFSERGATKKKSVPNKEQLHQRVSRRAANTRIGDVLQ
jgi:hypothetical protein